MNPYLSSPLSSLKPHLWKRLTFETKTKYYTVILQQDLFREWSIIRFYGAKRNKLGNFIIRSCKSYKDALTKIEELNVGVKLVNIN